MALPQPSFADPSTLCRGGPASQTVILLKEFPQANSAEVEVEAMPCLSGDQMTHRPGQPDNREKAQSPWPSDAIDEDGGDAQRSNGAEVVAGMDKRQTPAAILLWTPPAGCKRH